MLFCVVFKHTGGVFLCGFAVFIPPLHCTPPSFSLAFYQGHINQVNMVCHTYNHKKKLEELFTLSSELPFLADLVFWLYYIVLQFALLFLLIKIPKYVTQLAVHHWKKITLTKIKLTYCNFFKVKTCIRLWPLAVKKTRKLSCLAIYSYFKDSQLTY